MYSGCYRIFKFKTDWPIVYLIRAAESLQRKWQALEVMPWIRKNESVINAWGIFLAMVV